uniref:Putative ovule protein n=1 Tax=Solanum chacoense TaxID=4108 RepID=A0A0V0H9M3_SOLCH
MSEPSRCLMHVFWSQAKKRQYHNLGFFYLPNALMARMWSPASTSCPSTFLQYSGTFLMEWVPCFLLELAAGLLNFLLDDLLVSYFPLACF